MTNMEMIKKMSTGEIRNLLKRAIDGELIYCDPKYIKLDCHLLPECSRKGNDACEKCLDHWLRQKAVNKINQQL